MSITLYADTSGKLFDQTDTNRTPVTFTYTGGSITGFTPKAYARPLEIPSTLGGVTITSIGLQAFLSCTSLVSILIPASVTSIGDQAFYLCTNLATVTFAEGSQLISIGNRSFRETTSLTSIAIPSNVTTIQSEAFNRSGLTAVTFNAGSKLISIGTSAFSRSTNLTMVTFAAGSSLKTIDNYAFQLTGLTSIAIPESVTSIGTYVFESCVSLSSIIIPSLVTSIGQFAFNGCTGLESITFASGSLLTTIGQLAFKDCQKLMSIDIPASVISIGADAFNGCKKLTAIVIPNLVTSIGNSAFASCIGLLSFTLASGSKLLTINQLAFNGCTNLNSVMFGYYSKLLTINQLAFNGCTSLKTIYIPDSVTSIDSLALQNSGLITMYVSKTNGLGLIPSGTSVTQYGRTFTLVDVADTPSIPICFPAGTKVTTDQGDIAIEKLNPKVHTIRGKKIVTITKSIPLQKHIISIEKDSLATNVPSVTTQISKEHKLFYKGKMVKARDLVEVCQGVTAIPYNGEILYNVLLKKHDKMMINNLICETLHPENILAKIYKGNFQTVEKIKIYEKLNRIIRTNDIPEYNKLYASLK